MPTQLHRVTEYTTTLFGRVALFEERGGCVFRREGPDRSPVGPKLRDRQSALDYASRKGWTTKEVEVVIEEEPERVIPLVEPTIVFEAPRRRRKLTKQPAP